MYTQSTRSGNLPSDFSQHFSSGYASPGTPPPPGFVQMHFERRVGSKRQQTTLLCSQRTAARLQAATAHLFQKMQKAGVYYDPRARYPFTRKPSEAARQFTHAMAHPHLKDLVKKHFPHLQKKPPSEQLNAVATLMTQAAHRSQEDFPHGALVLVVPDKANSGDSKIVIVDPRELSCSQLASLGLEHVEEIHRIADGEGSLPLIAKDGTCAISSGVLNFGPHSFSLSTEGELSASHAFWVVDSEVLAWLLLLQLSGRDALPLLLGQATSVLTCGTIEELEEALTPRTPREIVFDLEDEKSSPSLPSSLISREPPPSLESDEERVESVVPLANLPEVTYKTFMDRANEIVQHIIEVLHRASDSLKIHLLALLEYIALVIGRLKLALKF